MVPGTTKAVFLSYAREDAGVARRIADALRSHGVEVWFDESELRGGDAWDQKIRRQIGECTLFLPIISRKTQERGKGYFRLEWKLAVEQTHLMAEGMSFLAPVVVDDTAESAAVVPPEFMSVQWIRLPGALPTPQFVEQVKRLLDAPHKALGSERGGHAAPREPADHAPRRKSGLPAWAWAAAAAALAAGAVVILRKPLSVAPPPKAETEAKPVAPAELAAPEKSVAVLPFANFSPDKDNEFFADGLHDEVITALAKIHDLKVISRTSVLAYRNPEGRNLKKIATELGVATILEGSVQRVGDKVHLNVQLIDARTDAHLWADSYTKDITDVFTVQSDLASAVTAALKATLSPEEKSLIVRRPTLNREAYDLYLRARVRDQTLAGVASSKEEYEKVIRLYEEAEAKDPTFALPHVQASILQGTMYWFALLDPTKERRAKAKAETDEANRLAPGSPEAALAQASFDYTCGNDWAKALAELGAAEAALPNDAQVQYRIAMADRRLGYWQDGLDRLERSSALNPNDLTGTSQHIGTVFAFRRYAETIDLIHRFPPAISESRSAVLFAIRAQYELDGDRAEFLRKWEEVKPLPGGVIVAGGRSAYDSALLKGDLAAAERELADPSVKVIANTDGTIGDPVALHQAFVAFLRGHSKEARSYAEEAIEYYHHQEWAPRQVAWEKMGEARAEAYAGRADEALRDAKAALDFEAAHDAYSSMAMRQEFGQLLVLCGRRDEAIAVLREMVSLPMFPLTPNGIRYDAVWSRMKDDPRFEETLKSAKPI